MNSYFNELTSWEIREQILKYNATFSMTDVERATFLGLPKGCRIRENAKIISQDKLSIGENCWIGEGAVLDASGELEIGDNTSIGLNVMVWTHDSHKLNIRGKNTKEHNSGIIRKKTKIGSNCFIAGPSVIMPGVTIGDKCIIAPMSVVYEDLPSKTIYQPYKKIIEQQKIIDTNTKKIELLEHQLNEFKELLKLFWENKNEQDNERINNLWGGTQEQKILNWLLRVYKRLFYGKKEKFDRGLPFADCFVDRWEKAEALGFGKGTSIYDSSLVLGDVKVGKNSWIGPNTILDGSGGLEIGSNCSISAGVQIYSHDSVNWSISGGKEKYEYAKTIIEDNCYIAPNVIIQKGVRIEKGSIIGANSFVNKDIPAGSKAFGTPVNIKKNNS